MVSNTHSRALFWALLASSVGIHCADARIPMDLSWDAVQQSRDRVTVRGHIFKVCLSGRVPLVSAPIQLVSMNDGHTLGSTTSDSRGAYRLLTHKQLLHTQRCELQVAGVTRVIGDRNPEVSEFDIALLCAANSSEAAALASYLANQECFRLYGDRPFTPDRWPAEQRGDRWVWGHVDPSGAGGYSASVSFGDGGRDADVRVFMVADAVDQ